MSTREQILVTVRTYPTPSTGNREVVCTGGITREGDWRRLYPVPLRYLPPEQQFRVWDIVAVDVEPAKRDSRPESRRPHLPTLEVVDRLRSWSARCEWVQRTCFRSLNDLIDAGRSLGPVWVKEVRDVVARPDKAEWDDQRRAKLQQMMLFDKPLPLEKIPYQFRFVWRDRADDEHDSLVISWEMAETWRQYRQRYRDPLNEIRNKLLRDYFGAQRSPAFFIGNHSRFRYNFMVCGWFVPPKEESDSEFLW